jgi:hypothetical protein
MIRGIFYHTTVNRLMTHRVGFSRSFNSENTQSQFAMISIRRMKSAYEKTRNSNSHACIPLHNGENIRVLYNIVNFTFLFSFEEARRREVRVCSDEGRHPRYLKKNKRHPRYIMFIVQVASVQ